MCDYAALNAALHKNEKKKKKSERDGEVYLFQNTGTDSLKSRYFPGIEFTQDLANSICGDSNADHGIV